LEVAPFLRDGPEFEFRDSSPIPLRLALNTPLISTLVQFSSCADALRIHPAVASILDDMRFLLAAVLALPEKPSAKELQKVHTTSAWIHERISGLPDGSPATRRPSATSSTASRDSSIMSETFEGSQSPQPLHNQARAQRQQQQNQRHGRTSSQTPTSHTQSQSPAPSPSSPLPTATPTPTPTDAADPSADHVYQAVRLAALLYSRAIMHRRPFSHVVTPDEFLRVWTTAWRVPLSAWRSLLGVLNWILLPLVPSGKVAQPHDRFVKGMMNISLFQMGMDNWEIASSVMEAGLSLQRWLAGESAGSSSEAGIEMGEKGKWRDGSGSPRGWVGAGEGGRGGGKAEPGKTEGEEERRRRGQERGPYGLGNMGY